MTSSSALGRALRVGAALGLVLTFLVCEPMSAFGQDLLLPEWEYEPAPESGRLKRGAGKTAEVSWSLLNDTLSDTWSITKSPLHWRLKGWLAAAAIAGVTTGLIYGVDQRVRDAAQGGGLDDARLPGRLSPQYILLCPFAVGWIGSDRCIQEDWMYLMASLQPSGYMVGFL